MCFLIGLTVIGILGIILGFILCAWDEIWWYVLIAVFGILGIIIIKNRESTKAREELEVKEKEKTQAYIKQNKENHQRMVVLYKESIDLFESLLSPLRSAQKYLDQAEVDYADNAFVPFWDSIEMATKALGYFDEYIVKIEDNLREYTSLLKVCEGKPPDFILSQEFVTKLKVGTTIAERMQSIVGKAQRNFQSAMTYEQHKTNQILIAGFKSLAQALDNMTQSITLSINDLVYTVEYSSSYLNMSV